MNATTAKQTDDRKRRAVELRLQGLTLKTIQEATSLSSPTITALHKAYLKGGWEALGNRRTGRPPKDTGPQDSTPIQAQLFAAQAHLLKKSLWDKTTLSRALSDILTKTIDERKALRLLSEWQWMPPIFTALIRLNQTEQHKSFTAQAKLMDLPQIAISHLEIQIDKTRRCLVFARGSKDQLYFKLYQGLTNDDDYCDFFESLLSHYPKGYAACIQFAGFQYTPQLAKWIDCHSSQVIAFNLLGNVNSGAIEPLATIQPVQNLQSLKIDPMKKSLDNTTLTHLQRLEAESIHIMREVLAEADKPVMLYSIGKDSAVMLHLALKAFYPAKLPFPLLHVDTLWKFQDMYRFRDQMAKEHDFELLVHSNPEGIAMGINPFTHGSQIHTDIMKTQALKQALDQYQFDVAFGGARRDEEKSRAKERIFSFRNAQHHWDPKQQRPELWNLYNAKKNKGESIRVFPISNWTELDIWQYIYLENIPIVPLYFSQIRPVVQRDGTWIMVDDNRMPLAPGEIPQMKSVRFRTLGCYPLTGAVESTATTLTDIIQEMLLTKTSERQGRVIDHDGAASMEKKKQEGYF